jgi:hypothetical protein
MIERCLGYKSTLLSCIFQSTPLTRIYMTAYFPGMIQALIKWRGIILRRVHTSRPVLNRTNNVSV